MTTSSTISTSRAWIEMEAAAKLERAFGPLEEHRRLAQGAAHFVADDHAAHRRRDDGVDPVTHLGGQLGGERLRQPLGPLRVHQHPRALQILGAAKAGREDEMAFEQRVGGAEFRENFIVGHHVWMRPLGCRTAAFNTRAKCRLRLPEPAPIGVAKFGGASSRAPVPTTSPGVKMRLIGLAIALAAAALTPAAAQAPATTPAEAAPTAAPPGGFAQNPTTPDAPTAPAAAGQTPVPAGSLGVRTEFDHTPAAKESAFRSHGGKGIQEQVTPIGEEAAAFHNNWLLLLCVVISIFVLGLLLWTMVRYRRERQSDARRATRTTP